MPANAVPVWLTPQEINLIDQALTLKYNADGGGGALMSDLMDKLGLAKKSSKTKKPATDPKRHPRKKQNP